MSAGGEVQGEEYRGMSAGEGVQGEECRGRNAGVRSEGEGVQRESAGRGVQGGKVQGGEVQRWRSILGGVQEAGYISFGCYFLLINALLCLCPMPLKPLFLVFNFFYCVRPENKFSSVAVSL